jgi:branched-chain amino acid transport system permease protein
MKAARAQPAGEPWRVRIGPFELPWPSGESAGAAWTRYAVGIVVLALLLVLLKDSPYYLNLLVISYVFAGLASAWNIIGGFGGQFSLGHGVFFATGAYVVAILFSRYHISPWLGLVPATLAAAAVGGLISAPIFRLRGPFFSIATLALNQIALVLVNYSKFLGGPRGVTIDFKPGIANMIFEEGWQYGLLALAFCALTIAVAMLVRRSRLGYYLLAVREDEDSARSTGINAFSVKLYGMLISSALTGVGGAIYAMFVLFVDPPTVFSLPDIGVRFALLALIGGIGTIPGPVVGALLITPAASYLRGALTGFRPGTHLIVLAIIMILAPLFMRRGIVGAIEDLGRRLRRRGAR